LHGLPIAANHEYTGSFWDLFQPYAVFTGITLVSISALHGATFISMKTTDEVRDRAERFARMVAPITALLVLAFIAWTHVQAGRGAFLNPMELIACIAVIAAASQAWSRQRAGWAFTATTIAIGVAITSIFVDLYPRVMVSSTSPANSITVHNAAAPPYSLKVLTVVALVLLPVVLAYQVWTYYVFRKRVSVQQFRPPPPAPPPSPRPSAEPVAAGSTRAEHHRRGTHLSWRGRRG